MKYYLFKSEKVSPVLKILLFVLGLIFVCIDLIIFVIALKKPYVFVYFASFTLLIIVLVSTILMKSDHGIYLNENQIELDEPFSNHIKFYKRFAYFDGYDKVIPYDTIKNIEITKDPKSCKWIGGKRKKGQERVYITAVEDGKFYVETIYGFTLEKQQEFADDLKNRISNC